MRENEQIKAMRALGMSDEEIAEVLACDKAIDQGKRTDFDLDPEKEKQAKKLANAGTRKKPITFSQTPKERKADEEKRSLIEKIASKMEDFHHMDEEIPASGVDLVEIVNPEREISFIIGENHYSLTLTRHRNNKK